jgi:hypothetical protein
MQVEPVILAVVIADSLTGRELSEWNRIIPGASAVRECGRDGQKVDGEARRSGIRDSEVERCG